MTRASKPYTFKLFIYIRNHFIILMKKAITLVLLICVYIYTQAQPPQLPAMDIRTENATNILTWNNQFDGVKSIAIQRSADSVRNFLSIGIMTNAKKGIMSYTDDRPMPGKNYYRLSVGFSGDLEWYSNTYKVIMDSQLIAQSLKSAVASGTTNSNTQYNLSQPKQPEPTDFYYTPSNRVFTNPYTGHINLLFEDALNKRYSIQFFDPDKKEVLKIGRINKKSLVLDKYNFNARGIYHFKIYDGTDLVETGYITIY